MMDWTDRHCRFFHRQLARHALLYTEMVTADAVIHGKRERLLAFRDDRASDCAAARRFGSGKLAEAAAIGAGVRYDEINLNVGCPSDRVQEGRFGACLMAEPELVARCVAAMQRARVGAGHGQVPHRHRRSGRGSGFPALHRSVADAGCTTFIVHARKAWLKGLSPKENREVPPLDYDRVYRLKAARPDLTIVINGGIDDAWSTARTHLAHVDGVMLGRAAYQTPYLLAEVDRRFFGGDEPALTRAEALERLVPYVERHLARGGTLSNVTRHILGLYHGQPRGRLFRRIPGEDGVKPGAGVEVLREALDMVERSAHARRCAADRGGGA